ncbi:MAG TPA: HEAT repeat domain-containing protein, partial [Vicinamibacterales bacterium]|nr:HEAT repeat domain-containing protein [Vicinamibacterales bacterium]
MSLFDRLRPTPRWKHPHPQVRLAAIQELDLSSPDTSSILARLGRQDPDARVRRAALARLDDPAVLAEAARGDADEGVRQKAIEALVALATGGAPDDPAALGRAMAALEGLDDQRHI